MQPSDLTGESRLIFVDVSACVNDVNGGVNYDYTLCDYAVWCHRLIFHSLLGAVLPVSWPRGCRFHAWLTDTDTDVMTHRHRQIDTPKSRHADELRYTH